MNYYKVLGVEENASQEEIKKAYKKQVDYFNKEVKDPNKLNKFIELFDEALNALVDNEDEEVKEFKPIIKNDNIEEKKDISVVDAEISNLFKTVEAKEKQKAKEDFTFIKSKELIEAIDEDILKNSNDKINKVEENLKLEENNNISKSDENILKISNEKSKVEENSEPIRTIKEISTDDNINETDKNKDNINLDKINIENKGINESYAATMVMSKEEIAREILKEKNLKNEHQIEEKVINKPKIEFESVNDFFNTNNDLEDEFEYIDEDDEYANDYIGKLIRKRKEKKKNKKRNSKNNNLTENKKLYNTKNNVNKNYNSEDKTKNRQAYDERNFINNNNDISKKAIQNNKKIVSTTNLKFLLIPLKILAFPIIIILTILSMIFKVINISAWIVSKIIIIAAIAVAAIQGYRIYTNQIPKEYEVFIICIVGFGISVFLPSILKVICNVIDKSNEMLKEFVF